MDTQTTQNETSAIIATLNDEFRKNSTGCTVTQGVAALEFVGEIFESVRLFDDFTEDNDPYGEHDFGSFEHFAHKFFWKIDYYDSHLKGWCDPLDSNCERVLTIMLAEEY